MILPKHISSARLAALGLLLGSLALPVTGQNAFAKALPEHTLAFVSFPDIATSFEEMKQMPLAKMWREDQVQDFFADALKMAEEAWNDGMAEARQKYESGELPFDPDELIKARLVSASFAVTDFGMQTMPEQGPMPRFGFLAHLDFGDTAPIWNNVLTTALEKMMEEAGEEMTRSLREVAGTRLHVFSATEPQGLDMSLNVAFVGTGAVVGTITSEVEGFLTRLQSKEAGLTATAEYQAAAGKLAMQGVEAEMFVRPGRAIDSLLGMMTTLRESEPDFPVLVSPEGIDRSLTALGLRSIVSVASASAYEGDKCVSRTFVAIPEEARRGLTAVSDATLEMDFLRWIPADAVTIYAGTMDTGSVWNALEGAVRAYDEKLGAQLMEQLGQMEEQVGISLEKDLFGAFGNRYVYWQMPMAAFGAFPELALIMPVNDPDRLVQTMRTAAEMSNGMVSMETVERRGITVHQLRFDLDIEGAPAMGINPADLFIPTIGFKDGHMVVGLSTADVKRAFTRMEREDDPSGDIRSNPEFAPWLEKIPTEGLSALTFTDWKSTFESFYQIVTSFMAFIPPGENIPFDMMLLPDSQTLTQHLFASVSWTRTDDSGMIVEAISPFGPEVSVVGGVVGAGVGIGLTTLGTVRKAEMRPR